MTEGFLAESTEAVARLAFRGVLNGVRRIAEDAFIHSAIRTSIAELAQLRARLNREAKLALIQRAQYLACPFREPEISVTVIDQHRRIAVILARKVLPLHSIVPLLCAVLSRVSIASLEDAFEIIKSRFSIALSDFHLCSHETFQSLLTVHLRIEVLIGGCFKEMEVIIDFCQMSTRAEFFRQTSNLVRLIGIRQRRHLSLLV